MYNSHFRFFAGKLLSKWEGPYVIEEVYRSGAIKINNAEGTIPKVVNGQQIKHYISGTSINVESNIIQTMTPEDHIKETVGFRVPAKPLRFEHWGAHEDLSLPNHTLTLTAISKPSSTNSQHKGHNIYTGSGQRCGVIPYSIVVVVDCLLG